MTFTNRFRRIDVCLPAALCLCGVLGCATFTTPAVAPLGSLPSVGDLLDREEPIAEPKGVAVVWTGAVFQKEASQPTRGFGGMVTFYGNDRKKPIRVDGQLTVYGYDDMSADEEDPVPDRKYVFKPEQLGETLRRRPARPVLQHLDSVGRRGRTPKGNRADRAVRFQGRNDRHEQADSQRSGRGAGGQKTRQSSGQPNSGPAIGRRPDCVDVTRFRTDVFRRRKHRRERTPYGRVVTTGTAGTSVR